MKDIIQKADEFALSEIEKFGLPTMLNYNLSNEKGLELAKESGADADIVSIGTRLMDIKLGEAFRQGRLKEHIEMGVNATKQFLLKFEIDERIKEKIIDCVKGHHGGWVSKEAEVCANADCYRFLLLRNWLAFFNSLGARNTTFEEDLAWAEKKADEKWDILSIEKCRNELERDYKLIKKIINKAKLS